MLARVPGRNSSPRLPLSVTSPGFCWCLSWRCSPAADQLPTIISKLSENVPNGSCHAGYYAAPTGIPVAVASITLCSWSVRDEASVYLRVLASLAVDIHATGVDDDWTTARCITVHIVEPHSAGLPKPKCSSRSQRSTAHIPFRLLADCSYTSLLPANTSAPAIVERKQAMGATAQSRLPMTTPGSEPSVRLSARPVSTWPNW